MVEHPSIRNPHFQAALIEHRRYQQSATADGPPRQSSKMRAKAYELSRRGHVAASHQLYAEALELFGASDDSAAAAAAAYDLAASHLESTAADGRSGAVRAWNLADRAEHSRARQRDPIRHALTLDLKAKIARTIHELGLRLPGDVDAAEAALQCHIQAIAIVENLGLPLRGQAATMRLHEANTFRSLGRELEALNALESAHTHIRHYRDEIGDGLDGYGVLDIPVATDATIGVTLAEVLLSRGRKKSLSRILALCQQAQASAEGRQDLAVWAQLVRISTLQRLGDEKQQGIAQQEFNHLSETRLPARSLAQFARVAELLDNPAEGCRAMLALAHKLVGERADASAQQAADRIAYHAQRAAAVAARMAAAAGDPLQAFLALEVACGLRMHDEITSYFHAPRSRVDQELQRANSVWSQIASFMQWLSMLVAPMPTEVAKSVLSRNIDQFADPGGKNAPAFEQRGLVWSLDRLKQAREAASPSGLLDRAATQASEVAQALERQLVARDPEFSRRSKAWSWPLDRQRLVGGLRDNPGTVVVHASWQSDLLLLAAWLDAGDLQCSSLIVPVGLDEALALRPTADWTAVDEARSQERQLRELVNIDVGPLLDDCTAAHVCVIPSFLASWIPWPIVGTLGATLLDRFESISQTFSFTNLEFRQAPRPARIGTLVVAPGNAVVEGGTTGHEIAFQASLPNEEALLGADATVKRVLDQALHHDVVTFFCHGLHGDELDDGGPNPMRPDEGALVLADGHMRPSAATNAFEGAERVELWACRSGVNLPVDPMGAGVLDDGFGLDASMLRLGARTAIGSLVRVPDVAAGHLLRRHRQHISEGSRPDVALARAMRWWRDEMCARLHDAASGRTRREAELAIAEVLEVEHDEITKLCFLGRSRRTGKLSAEDVTSLLHNLCGIHAWGMYRFLGICERRPKGRWNPELDRPLTDAEAVDIDALINSATAEDPSPVGDDPEPWCAAARAHRPGEPVSAELALDVARGYLRRQRGSFVLNVCRALAWLLEAEGNPDLYGQQATLLRVEQAWLWLELLRTDGWWPHPIFRPRPNRAYLARLGGTVARTSTARELVTRAWCAFLAAPYVEQEATNEAWERLFNDSMAATLALPPDTVEGLRCRTGLSELLAECDPTLSELPNGLDVRSYFAHVDAEEILYWLARLDTACSLIAIRNSDAPNRIPTRVMSSRVAAAMWFANGHAAAMDGVAVDASTQAQTNIVNHLERQLWGAPADGGERVRSQPGAPGDSWHTVVGAYIVGALRQPEQQLSVPHLLASLGMGADLHVTAQMQLARLARGQAAPQPLRPWTDARDLSTASEVLREIFERRPAVSELGAATGGASHAVRKSAVEWLGFPDSVADFGLWTGALVVQRRLPKALVHSVPFGLELAMLRMEQAGAESARTVDRIYGDVAARHEEAATLPPTSLVVPNRRLLDHEGALNGLKTGAAVLGVVFGPYGEVALMSLFGGGSKPVTRTWMSEPGKAQELRVTVGQLMRQRGVEHSQTRQALLEKLTDELSGGLEAVLGDPSDTDATDLLVLAPGPLRALPWSGLPAGSHRLFERFASVRLLPTLDFATHAHPGAASLPDTVEICVSPTDAIRQRGPLTTYIVDQLRRARPKTITIGPNAQRALTEELIAQGRANRSSLQGLRVTGAAPDTIPSPSAGGVVFGNQMPLLPGNAQQLYVPSGRWAEVWAATTSDDRAEAVSATAEDRMPPLPRTLLESGFAGVQDLAWQVPDYVQAVLVEACAVFRDTLGMDACHASNAAQRVVRWILEEVRGPTEAPTTWEEALQRLDEARRRAYADQAPGWKPIAFTAAEWTWLQQEIDEQVWLFMTDPENVVAVRWWGA